MADVAQKGVIDKYLAGYSILTTKTDELPADILVFPVMFIVYRRLLRVGHTLLLDRV